MKSPIRSLNLMPGVQYGLPLSNIHLQGGEPGDHRIYLDGVPIYNPYSFGRMFSSFSPYAIGDVTLHKAGYGVAHGSQMAGMIHLRNDISHNRDSRAILQADPLSVNLRGDVAIPSGDERSIQTMAAFRTNFWDQYQEPALSNMLGEWDRIDPLLANAQLGEDMDAAFYTPMYRESDVGIMDLHVAASYEPGSFSRIDGSFYLAENSVQSNLLNQSTIFHSMPRYLFASDSYEWRNLAGQISWNQLVTPRLDFTIQAGYTHNQFQHENILGTSNDVPFPGVDIVSFSTETDVLSDVRRRLPTQVDENSIRHWFLKTDLSYSINPQFSIDGGLKMDFVSSEVRISDQPLFPASIDDSSIILSGYLQNNHNFGRGWRIDYGSRLTWLNYRNRLFAEPRASLQYDEDDTDLGFWSLRVTGGLYRQFINEYRVSNVGASSLVPNFSIWSHADNLEVPLATHFSGSFLVEPSNQPSFTVEGFYKWQPNSPITSYGMGTTDPHQDTFEHGVFAEMTEFTTLGAGFRFRQSLANSRIRFLGGYDYSYTKLNLDSQFGRTLPAPQNEPHRAQARVFYHAVEEVTFALKWQGIWGRSWAFRDSYYNYLQYREVLGADEFSFTTPENDRLSAFQQVDFSMIYQTSIGFADLEVRVELINILNRKNTLDHRLVPVIGPDSAVEYQVDKRQFPGFYPTMSVEVQF